MTEDASNLLKVDIIEYLEALDWENNKPVTIAQVKNIRQKGGSNWLGGGSSATENNAIFVISGRDITKNFIGLRGRKHVVTATVEVWNSDESKGTKQVDYCIRKLNRRAHGVWAMWKTTGVMDRDDEYRGMTKRLIDVEAHMYVQTT